jgi:hypothetical protein
MNFKLLTFVIITPDTLFDGGSGIISDLLIVLSKLSIIQSPSSSYANANIFSNNGDIRLDP